jgi:hypothetical protein
MWEEVMRTFLAVFFTSICGVACAMNTTESVYDLPTHKYEGNGGSGPSGPGSSGMDAATCPVQGTASVSGVTLGAKDALELFDATKARFEFLITDYANACALAGAKHAGSSVLAITFMGTVLEAGDYDLSKTPGMTVTYTTYGAGCTVTQTEKATAGTMTIKKLDICGSDADVDVTIGGQKVTASFTASTCALPDEVEGCK